MAVIGLSFLFLVYRLWWVHPINRVLKLGPFVTERGIRAVLGLRMTLLSFGVFLLAQGSASIVYWYFRARQADDPLVQFLGSLAAGLGVWAAVQAITQVVRVCRIR